MRTTIFGQLVRAISRSRVFRYPDEIDPSLWKLAAQPRSQPDSQRHSEEKQRADRQIANDEENGHHQATVPPTDSGLPSNSSQQSGAPADEVWKESTSNGPDIIIVGWYGPDDPENPQNWSTTAKSMVTFQMCLLNFAVYIGSSIFVPGESSFIADFGVGEVTATLGLSLFTLGYAMGPMLWSPLSEMPAVGRTGIFFYTLLAFIVFQLPVGFAPNAACFFVFRWVTGFCGSPCLATGGGTINDIYAPTTVPYFLCIWAAAGIGGPVLGPLIGGFVAPAEGWRWTIWVFTWLCCVVLITMFFLFPETSSAKILYSRAKRLRKATGNDRLKSAAEVDSGNFTPIQNLVLIRRAFTLTFTQPIILLMDLYAGLLYGILFTWFESFPIVFGGMYSFTPGEQGLVFIGILVFAVISVASFLFWINKKLVPPMTAGTFKLEMILPPTVVGAIALPICLFMFAWTSQPNIPWIVPVIASGLFAIAIVTLFNPLYMYIGMTYADYAASIFAGATLFRGLFGATFPLFARALFSALGIGGGCSLLGGISVLFIPVPFIFISYGERIRGWSKYAG